MTDSTYEVRTWDSETNREVRFVADLGKFEGESIFAEWLYDFAMNGDGETVGDSDIGNATRFDGPFEAPDDATDSEREIFGQFIGAIMRETCTGFICCEFYTSDERERFEAEWYDECQALDPSDDEMDREFGNRA